MSDNYPGLDDTKMLRLQKCVHVCLQVENCKHLICKGVHFLAVFANVFQDLNWPQANTKSVLSFFNWGVEAH